MKMLVAVQFFIISLLLTSSYFVLSSADSSCGGKCNVRCSKADRTHEECLEDCNICCQQCNCVPSGTYGNKDECPCYRDMKNSKGGSKCP
ncbi:gibberellin-regulated protein 8 [Arabidopsis lyrata subsp. lyrata]|uniref:gibberellin-regulated protein 8 n=1 Tax=Arabidopsis lyrata subsp. lyrata TaxID=81972 RepID=UPI000A29D9BF|nr:gibberellin-regulated protein 8 [Arabidopsis lyrata subsp. lyrata]|eukprot:XP_020870811.1 gibberellin-regulated protein 8 [Arabidopsis lyrata subsp. lyrata]